MGGRQTRDDIEETAQDHQAADEAVDEAFDAIVDQESPSQQAEAKEGESAETLLDMEKDRVLRLQAEMENLRNRTAREIAESRRYAAIPLVRDLLPVVDNIERAIEAAQQSEEPTTLLEGFQLVHQQILNVLQQHHCQPIKALGEPFDPQFHDAILQQPNEEIPANHIATVTQVGYLLHDRVVRPAQVIISTGPAEV